MDVSAFYLLDIDTMSNQLTVKIIHDIKDDMNQVNATVMDAKGFTIAEKTAYSIDNAYIAEIGILYWLQNDFMLWGNRYEIKSRKVFPSAYGNDIIMQIYDKALPKGACMCEDEEMKSWEEISL